MRDLITEKYRNNRKIIEDLTEESTLPKSTPQKDVHWTSFFFVQIFHIKFCKIDYKNFEWYNIVEM